VLGWVGAGRAAVFALGSVVRGRGGARRRPPLGADADRALGWL